MSARFVTNFIGLLAGAGLVTAIFAFSGDTAGWVSVGAGGVAIVLALTNFALAHQGVYQRCADVIMAAFSAGLSARLVMRFGIRGPLWVGLLIATGCKRAGPTAPTGPTGPVSPLGPCGPAGP